MDSFRFNRTVKDNYTLHEKKAIDVFLQTLERAVSEMSRRLGGEQTPDLPQVSPKLMTKAQLVSSMHSAINMEQAIVKKATFFMSASLLRALAVIVRACYSIVLLQVPPSSSLFSHLL